MAGDAETGADVNQPTIRSRVPTRLLEAWEERAAIMEFDGKLPRDEAEKAALVDVLRVERQREFETR